MPILSFAPIDIDHEITFYSALRYNLLAHVASIFFTALSLIDMTNPSHQVRIISGQWRGRKLHFPANNALNSLRPTSDRIRETLFNWLDPVVRNASCLDAFAGSGALGWEALSRGAKHCDFLDNHRSTFANLKEQQSTLNAQQHSTLYSDDTCSWLSKKATRQYQIVFLDPPFALTNAAQTCIDLLCERQWLSQHALIYVEQPKQAIFPLHPRLKCYRHKQAGQVQYGLLEYSY